MNQVISQNDREKRKRNKNKNKIKEEKLVGNKLSSSKKKATNITTLTI